jgi:hypothetical protein
VVPNPVLNLLVYRRDLSSLWRRLERLEAIELESSEKSMVYECAKILAEVSGLPRNKNISASHVGPKRRSKPLRTREPHLFADEVLF